MTVNNHYALAEEHVIAQLKEENRVLNDKLIRMDQLVNHLEHSEHRFETIFEHSSLGNKVINSNLEIIKFNKSLTKLLGYSKEELLGMQIMDIAHPDYKAPWKALQQELWTHKKNSFSIDACIIKKDKSVLWCHITSILFYDQDQTFGYAILEDIGWRKEMEEQVKQMNLKNLKRQKEHQQKILEVVISTQEEEKKRISESLHNNLGQMFYGVRLNLDQINFLLVDQGKNLVNLNKSKELLSECIRESRRMAHELTPMILEDFGLFGAIEDTCSNLNGLVKFSCSFIGTSKKLNKSLEIAVYRIVQELILNVVKHAEASSAKIKISIHSAAVIIKVEDNGKGFEPNEEVSKGLGLRYLKSRLQLLKGNLRISSIFKQGTTVTISLPNNVIDGVGK
jgi:PAS domain S-box-containing protein